MHDPFEDALNIYKISWKKFFILPLTKQITKVVVVTIIIKLFYAFIGAFIGIAAGFIGFRLSGGLGIGKPSEFVLSKIPLVLEIGMFICAIFFILFGDTLMGYFFRSHKKKRNI